MFLHWAVAGLDRGHLHLSDTVPPSPKVVVLVLFALAWIALVWAMYVNRFFSSIRESSPSVATHRNKSGRLRLYEAGHAYSLPRPSGPQELRTFTFGNT
jgi:hypothetical protein